MQLDIERYRPYLDQFDIGEAEKMELLQIVSHMMRGFVDLAFGQTSAQILLGTDDEFPTSGGWIALDSESSITIEFNEAAQENAENESPS
jgi:hypothetical protein